MKTVLITGATSGIGSLIAHEFLQSDNQLILTSRSADKLKLLSKKLGKNPDIFTTDLSSIESINDFILAVKDKYSSIDVLINVAGIWHIGNKVLANIDFNNFDQQTIVDTLHVGTLAPLLLTHAFIPLMKKNSKIVNISGTFESGAKGWLPYYVSKRALEDLTIGLSEELKEKDIQVNCVSPSDTATEAYKKHFPQYIQDAIEPQQVAKQVAYLCSSKADNITGKVFIVKKGIEPYEGFHV